MKVFHDLGSMSGKRKKVYLAAGFFDGVHAGHQRVLKKTVELADLNGGTAWCLTFDTHPMKILSPANAPLMLTSNRHKTHLLDLYGLDGCLLLPFNRSLASLTPVDFVEKLLKSIPALAGIVVGRNWRFGHGGKGCPAMLSRMGRKQGFEVSVVRSAVRAGGVVSSTKIRKLVADGDLEQAGRMLGRDFSIMGTVTRGRTIGRRLGFPTANIEHQNEVFPPCGVYAVYARVYGARPGRRESTHAGVLNMGVNPTFGGRKGGRPGLELHLFDFDSDIYGCEVEVFFLEKLRSERKFTSEPSLIRQITMDVEKARRITGSARKNKKNER